MEEINKSEMDNRQLEEPDIMKRISKSGKFKEAPELKMTPFIIKIIIFCVFQLAFLVWIVWPDPEEDFRYYSIAHLIYQGGLNIYMVV